MLRKMIVMLGLFSVLLGVGVFYAQAQDPDPTPEPGTPEDNRCYREDVTCAPIPDNPNDPTYWEAWWQWNCGWYVARWEANPNFNVPDWCDEGVHLMMPAQPPSNGEVPPIDAPPTVTPPTEVPSGNGSTGSGGGTINGNNIFSCQSTIINNELQISSNFNIVTPLTDTYRVGYRATYVKGMIEILYDIPAGTTSHNTSLGLMTRMIDTLQSIEFWISAVENGEVTVIYGSTICSGFVLSQ